VSLDEARALAREAVRKIQAGLPLKVDPLPSVGAVAELWLTKKVEGEGHRTARERRRIIERHIKPHVGDLPIAELRRSTVSNLLDLLVERHGEATADKALAVLSAICRWLETRDDAFRSPIVKGMRRGSAASRDRMLTDSEIRAVWTLAEASGPLGAFVQLALLTGQRRGVLTGMRWDQIDANGVWHIPRLPRQKQSGGDLRLAPLARAIIDRQPRIAGDARVLRFSYWPSVQRFQKAAGLAPWRIHDLRRCARSLLSRAGVQTEISELVLGHSIKGIQKVYDRHSYFEEKGQALARLAALIERIVSPSDNIVTLGAAS
jgi:integrase